MRKSTLAVFLVITVITSNSLFAAGDSLDSNSVVFQTFYWDVPGGGTWYNTIKDKAPGLKSAGFTHFWFPPPTKGASGGYSMGYDLYDNYDLGNYYQKGTTETRFGSLSELQAAAAACGNVLIDLVCNHMMGASNQCVDSSDGKTYWQNYSYPHGTFEKGCCDFHPGCPDDCDNCDGHDYLMGEDVCHKVGGYMFNGQRDWASWVKATVGNVSGFRLDAVKHFSWDMGKELGTIGSCIGEYWDNKTNILNWMNYTGNYGWDFPLYYSMQGNAANLDGAGLCSNKGVSFVANHDTDDISQKDRAYGFIMYIEPVPCVFWSHWFGTYQTSIQLAMDARNTYDFSGTGAVYKTTNLIIFNNNGAVYGCFNSAGTTGSGTITASPNTTYRAIAWGPGNRPSDVTSDGSGSVTLTAPAGGYSYWYGGGNIGPKAAVPHPVNGEINISPDIELSWLAGDGAVSHDVYFGTDYNDVNDATNPDVLPGRGNQTATTFNPGTLVHNTTYYWRIDEIDAGDNTTTGDLWSFTVRSTSYLSAYDTVRVPGNSTAVFGSWWDPAGVDNEMTLVADYTWRWIRRISSPTSVEYKFAMNGSWGINRGLGSTSGLGLPQNNWSLVNHGANIHANLPAATCVWVYYEDTETSKLYVMPADLDIDGDVDFADYAALASRWMDDACAEPSWCDDADLDKDGSVDWYDIAKFAEFWLLDVN